MRLLLSRIDDLVERVERLVVLVFLAVMSGAVFLDVIHRVCATPNGIILRTLTALWPGEPTPALATVGVPLVGAVFAWIFWYGTLRTAKGSTLSAGRSAGAAVGITGITALLLFALLKLFPNGLVWSQPLSLGLLLWVALLGATLATKARAHIVLEVAEKLWPPSARRWTRLAGGLVAASFCLLLLVLATNYTADFYEQWQSGVGYLSGIRLPKWVVLVSMPVCFTLMSIRMIAYSIGDFLTASRAPAEA